VGIGREVADAYIDVHGDLSSFRRDLNDLSGAEEAAMKQADKFTKAWADRIESDVNNKWASIVDAMYSDNKIDWDKLIGAFDGRSLEDANTKITEFMDKMRAAGKLTTKQYEDAKKAIDGQIDSLREQNKLLDRQAQEERGLGMAIDANRKFMAAANAENERWARTWDGMRKNNTIKGMEEDFRKLAAAMNFADMKKFADSFDSLIKARSRIYDITAAMQEQGRISAERAAELHAHFQAFVDDENIKSKMMKDALEETKRLKKAQDDYNVSLRGMAQAFHTADMEAKFRQLATAIESNDWSGMARGAKNMEELRNRTMETANEMRRLGRMTEQELTMVEDRFERVTQNARKFNVEFKDATKNGTNFGTTMRNVLTRTGNLFTRLGNITRGFREHLGGFAGINVFSDMIRGGLDFIHNLDRISVSLGKNTLLMGTMGAVGVSALASLFPIAQDLLSTLGGLAVALPAFAVGFGIGMGVLITALQDTKTVLADLKPAFAELQNQISSSFWKEAAGPIREVVAALMPILTPKLKGTATALGGLVGKLAKAFQDIPADKINDMFDRMNEAIEILGDAMAPIIRAFTTLGDIGSKYFARFSTWIVKLSNQFDAFIQRSAANGDLDKWINDMIEGFKDLGRIVDGTMGIFNALNTAAERAGFGGIKTLADQLQRAAAIMQTPEFQTTLITYLDGARDLATKLGTAIKDLGPAFESFAPTANIALNNIGDAASRIVGYVGQIFSNPTFQKGFQDFTTGLDAAVAKLEPAIKPFGDSLGNALSLLGQIVVNVAEVAAAFTITLGPVLDSMSAKMSTLIEPLKNTALNFVSEMEGPLKALDEQFIGPLVTAFNEKLLPAINGFIDEFGPFATKVIQDIGPSFKILVDDVLPNFVKFATELLGPLGKIIELLAPTLATTLTNIATAFSNLTDSIKVLKGELPVTELFIFKAMDPAKIKSDAEAAKQEVADNMSGRASTTDWGTVISDIFWGQRPDVFWSRVYSLLGPNDTNNAEFAKSMNELGTAFEGMKQKVIDDWNAIWSGKADREFTNMLIDWFPGQADFLNGVQGWTDDVFSGKWFGEILPELGRQWDEIWNGTLDRKWTDQMIEWFPDQADFLNGVQGWTDDVFSGKWFGEVGTNISNMWNDTWKEGGTADQIDANVNGWLKTNIGDPFTGAMDTFGKSIPESFKNDVQEWGLIPAIGNHFNNVVFPAIRDAFTKAWTSITDGSMLKGMQEESGKRWEGFWTEWNNFWGGFGSMSSDIETWFEDWWNTNVHDPFNKAVTDAWKHLFEGGDGGGGGGGGGGDQKSWFETFWNWIVEVFTGTGGTGEINKTVNKWLDDNVWKPIGEFFTGTGATGDLNNTVNDFLDEHVWKPIGDWFKDIDWGQIAEDLWSGFVDALSANTGVNWKKAAEGFTGWVEDIREFFGIHSPSTLMFDMASDIVNGFLNGFGEFATSVGEKWEEIKTALATKFEEIKTALGTWIEERKTDWNNFWGSFGETIALKWEEFKTTLATKFEEVKTALNLWIEERKTEWNAFWTNFGETISTKWEEFKTTLATKWEEIKTGINLWIEERKTDWTNFWTAVGETLRVKWEEFKSFIATKVEEIKNGINTWIETVKTNWNNFWTTVGDTVRTKWEEFKNTISTKYNEIKTGIDNFANDVKTNWENFWRGVGDTLRTKWEEFKTTASTKGQEIIDWFKGLPQKIVDAMGNLWTKFTSVGSDIANGLKAGIDGGIQWVKDAATNIANAAKTAAEQALDSHSPSRVFEALGLTTGQGLVVGIDRMGPEVGAAGADLIKNMQAGVESRMDPLLNTLQSITDAVTDTVSADLSKSKMYVTGMDAAQGLADGLKANRSSVHTALSNLGAFTAPASQIMVSGSFPSVGRPTEGAVPGRSVTIAEGAIKVITPTKNPELVAAKVMDSFANFSNF
jgi:phage-related protein